MSTISSWVKTSSTLTLLGRLVGSSSEIYLGLGGQGVFFLLWPLFARAKRHWFLEFFAVGPGFAKCLFLLLRSVGRRDLSAGPEPKKNTTQGVSFRSGPGERQGKEKPRWAPARGQSKKKKHTKKTHLGGVFFCSGPVPAPNGACPSPAFPRSKKNTSPSLAFPGAGAKKSTLGGVFFLLRPRADAPSPGCFSFFAAAAPGPGWCLFFLLWPRPDAHSLAVGWGDFGKARVVFFFAAAPPGQFRQ